MNRYYQCFLKEYNMSSGEDLGGIVSRFWKGRFVDKRVDKKICKDFVYRNGSLAEPGKVRFLIEDCPAAVFFSIDELEYLRRV